MTSGFNIDWHLEENDKMTCTIDDLEKVFSMMGECTGDGEPLVIDNYLAGCLLFDAMRHFKTNRDDAEIIKAYLTQDMKGQCS